MNEADHCSTKNMAATAADNGLRETYGHTITRFAVEFAATIPDAQSAPVINIRPDGGLVRMRL